MSETPLRVGTPGQLGQPGSLVADDLTRPLSADESTGKSALEALRETLATPVQKPPVRLRVPARDDITVAFRTNMSQEERKAWQARATKKKRGREEIDDMHYALLVLANTCVGIFVGGVQAHDADDQPLTFAHKQVWEMVGGTDTASTIRAFYGVDAHVLMSSGEVMLSSGFDDDVDTDEGGPTQGS